MKELLHTGYMHNHMWMYWRKKILEWSPSPEEAHATVLYIMNKHFLDGCDANSYVNVAWVFGQHDKSFKGWPVLGKYAACPQEGWSAKQSPRSTLRRWSAL